uniref:Uncharacterized protein n=1 Tax=Rhizochromulina marina TaxID=1034831 RepID=A0A7S2WTY2_9STRA
MGITWLMGAVVIMGNAALVLYVALILNYCLGQLVLGYTADSLPFETSVKCLLLATADRHYAYQQRNSSPEAASDAKVASDANSKAETRSKAASYSPAVETHHNHNHNATSTSDAAAAAGTIITMDKDKGGCCAQ